MTQRWMQRNLLKIKKAKRVFPKRKPSAGLDKERMNTYYARVNSSSQNNTFMQTMPETKPPTEVEQVTEFEMRDRVEQRVTRPRVYPAIEAREKSRYFRLLQTDRLQRMEELIKGPCFSNWKGVEVHLWFSGQEYYIIKETATYKAWAFYSDRAQAYADWQNNRVIWEAVVKKEIK